MKVLSLALYVSLGVLVATPVLAHDNDSDRSQAARFEPLGRDDHDRLRQLDLNRDGRITMHELRAVQRREQSTYRRPDLNRVDHRTYRLFAALDRNRDGVLSAKEWRIARHHRRPAAPQHGWRHDD
jgi:hypothetical protein